MGVTVDVCVYVRVRIGVGMGVHVHVGVGVCVDMSECVVRVYLLYKLVVMLLCGYGCRCGNMCVCV